MNTDVHGLRPSQKTLGEKLVQHLAETNQSQKTFAERVGVTQSAVAQWIAGTPIRAERVLDAARETGWRITPHEWRQDLYPHPDDGMPKSLVLTGMPSEAGVAT